MSIYYSNCHTQPNIKYNFNSFLLISNLLYSIAKSASLGARLENDMDLLLWLGFPIISVNYKYTFHSIKKKIINS